MKIGVISDTHGNLETLKRALVYFEDADMILHAGDVLYHAPRLGCQDGYSISETAEVLNNLHTPLIIAQGNCDAQVYEELLNIPVQAPYAYAVCNQFKFLVTHGHNLTKTRMIELAERYNSSFFISGHTHIPVLERVGGIILMNPGSPSIPKYPENDPVPSIGVITDTSAKIINIDNGSTLMELSI